MFKEKDVDELEYCWDCSGEGFEDLIFFDEEVCGSLTTTKRLWEVDKVFTRFTTPKRLWFECCESCELKDCDKVDCSVPY